jgi:hypothetical protein
MSSLNPGLWRAEFLYLESCRVEGRRSRPLCRSCS